MNLDLSGKSALVCGGSKGLGYGSAVELAKLGCQIVLLARSEEKLHANISELDKLNGLKNSYICVDLLDINDAIRKITEVTSANPIHILINNTGGPSAGTIQEATSEELSRAFNMHIIASQEISRCLIPFMTSEGYGRIINIVSTSVRQPIPRLGVSNTIRGAMASWSKTLSTELASTGITVNNVLPGTTKTSRIDELMNAMKDAQGISLDEVRDNFLKEIAMGRFAEVEEIASLVAFLASPAASYITGTSIPADGGKIKSI